MATNKMATGVSHWKSYLSQHKVILNTEEVITATLKNIETITKVILTTKEVITANLKVISATTKVILATNKMATGVSHWKRYLNQYLQCNLGHRRSDHSHFKNYLNHYKSDLDH